MRFYDIAYKAFSNLSLLPTTGRELLEAVPYWLDAVALPDKNTVLIDSTILVAYAWLTDSEVDALRAAGLEVALHRQNTARLLEETPAGTTDTLYTIYGGIKFGNPATRAENFNSAEVGTENARRIYYQKKADGTTFKNYKEAPYTTGVSGNGTTSWAAFEVVNGEIPPTHLTDFGVERLQGLGYKGAGVKIGYIDTGFENGTHPDIVIEKSGDTGIYPVSGNHAKGTIGIIAAQENGAGLKGMQPAAQIYSYSLNNVPSSLSALISDGVQIINCSFASFIDPATKAALKACEDAGIIVVVSAGNFNFPTQINDLAANRACVPVTGLRTGDCYEPSDVVHFGQTLPLLGKTVEWATPVIALVCAPVGTAQYSLSRGTSFSAPIFAGLLSIVMQAYPNLPGRVCLELMRLNAREIAGGFIVPDLSFIKHQKPS